MSSLLSAQELLEHYKNSVHRGKLQDASFTVADYNPSCGDRICFYGKITAGNIVALKFEGSGCIISQASASLVAEHCAGRSLEEVLAFSKDQLLELVGLALGPNRIKCVLLPLFTLHEGIVSYKRGSS